MTTKKKTALGASAAALLAAVFVGLFGGGAATEMRGSYAVQEVSPYAAEITVSVPEDYGADIFELQMGDFALGKGILPAGKILTHPIAVSDLTRLSVVFYTRGEASGAGAFSDDGVLLIKTKEGAE